MLAQACGSLLSLVNGATGFPKEPEVAKCRSPIDCISISLGV